jgi:hypothetical protein
VFDSPTSENLVDFNVFAVSKALVYAGATVNFPVFEVADQTAPVTSGGIPMISTSVSYFLSAEPTLGYTLLAMKNPGSVNASLVAQAFPPSTTWGLPVRAPQAGSSGTLDTLDARIEWSPVNDGTRIWFAHTVSTRTVDTTVQYGNITLINPTLQLAQARHSTTSADFNASIGVGINPNGTESVTLNWAYTDVAHGLATSDTVDSFVSTGGSLLNLVGSDVTLVNGGPTGQDRFGDYSSVAVDPGTPDGSCAVTAQQYFAGDGTWRTRIGEMCGAIAPPTIFDLNGRWLPAPGPVITVNGIAITVDMSAFGRPPATGTVVDPSTIRVTFPDDATYTGHLATGPNRIIWSNNTVWTKS